MNDSGNRGDPRNRTQPPWLWPVVIEPGRVELRPVDPQATDAPVRRTAPLRIGDAERDQAVSALGDHFAAGRLTREELDERIDQAVAAKFTTDLEPLLSDLPAPAPSRPSSQDPRSGFGPGHRPVSPLMLVFPIMLMSLVVTAVAIGAPWLIWGLVWMAVLTRFWGRGWAGPVRHPQWAAQRPGGPGPRG